MTMLGPFLSQNCMEVDPLSNLHVDNPKLAVGPSQSCASQQTSLNQQPARIGLDQVNLVGSHRLSFTPRWKGRQLNLQAAVKWWYHNGVGTTTVFAGQLLASSLFIYVKKCGVAGNLPSSFSVMGKCMKMLVEALRW